MDLFLPCVEMPHFVIDMGLWPYHSPQEKKLLMRQIKLSIFEVRAFGSDKNLSLVSVPEDLAKKVSKWGFSGGISSEKAEGVNLVLLDPHADDVLKNVDLNKRYIIGGIVDKSRRIKTRSLWYDVPRKKLEFCGSTVGVPDRINLLIRILCENAKGIPIRKSIINNMPRREKSERVKMEMSRGKSTSEVADLLQIPETEVLKFIQQ